jgi:hypothetical protein
MTITLDENQNIYRPKGQWNELGIDSRDRVHKLPCVWRNTSETADFAARFLGRKGGGQEKAEPQLKLSGEKVGHPILIDRMPRFLNRMPTEWVRCFDV